MTNAIDAIYKEIGESDYNQDVKDWLGTGYMPLNKIIGGRYDAGFPVGRVIEIFGGPSSGKTLLATMACIQTQKKDGLAVFLDHEHAFSLSRAVSVGLDQDRYRWIYKQPTTAEESFKWIETIAELVRKEHPDKFVTVIIDSVASMITKAELETEYGAETMKTRLELPLLLSSALKKLSRIVSKTNVTLILLNQTRDNPGVMFGDKKSTPGGNALKFYASVRVKLTKTGKVKDDDNRIIGDKVRAEVIKNKVFEPFYTTEYVTNFTCGINLVRSHIEDLKKLKAFGGSGTWIEFGGEKYQGLKKLEEAIATTPGLYADLLALYDHIGKVAESENQEKDPFAALKAMQA